MSKHKAGKGSSSKAAGTNGTASEAIMESMRCPVCTELLLTPIYQCERGHNICNSCIEEVHECPLCKGDYGDTRNYFAEDLVNSMSFPCKYAEYGCTTNCLGSILKEHQENCEFQPYRCPELACQTFVGQGQMAQHLEKHGFKIMEGEAHIATVDIQDKHFDSKTEYSPWRIRTFGNEFYTVASRQRDKNWYFWSWILALPKTSKKYSCEIILSSSEKEVVYRGCVHSLRIPPEDIIKSANALVLTDHMIRSLRENGKISCRVRFIQGKNWDRETKKEKKLVVTKKNQLKCKVAIHGKPFKAIFPKIPNLVRSQSITMANTAIKKLSKSSVGSTSAPSTSRALPVIKGRASPSNNTIPKKLSVSDAEQSLVLKMRETLKCPGCAETISPPIFVCTVGHSVCDACRTKLGSTCPLCRSPITGLTRNFFAEELLYKTVQKCRFHTSGCDVCLPAVQIRLHEDSCAFAPYECPFSTCRKVFQPNELLEHMKTHDLATVYNEINMPIVFPKPCAAPMCAIPSIVIAHGIPFYPLMLREASGAWAFWVASSDANNFAYEVRIKKQSKLLAFQGRVMSLRLSPNQILLRGEGLITTEKAIKTFKNLDKFDFSLKIAPIKGFAKSGVTFLTPLCSGSKSDVLTNQSATKTEIFATAGTSKDKRRIVDEDDDDEDDDGEGALFFARMRRRNTYAGLFASEDEDDDVLSVHGSSPASRSSQSLKKTKSESSLSSTEFQDDDRSFCSNEMKRMEIGENSQTNVFFNAVTHVPQNEDEDEAIRVTTSSKSKGKTGEGTKGLPVKKKSALKLKETDSRNLANVKESASAKKVGFSPTAEIFNAQQQDFLNNNWLEFDTQLTEEEIEIESGNVELNTSASDSSLLKISGVVNAKSNSSLDQISTVKSSESLKLHSKLEVFGRSCFELKNCDNRKLMRSRMQQLSQSLLMAIEEVDEEHETEEDKEPCKWMEISERGETGTEEIKGHEIELTCEAKSSSHNLIDLSSDPEVNKCSSGNSLSMGEFDGPIEVIIRAEDKIASISLSNITKNLDSTLTVTGSSSDGSLLKKFDVEIPIKEAGSVEEFVEERENACQVGSSLMRLSEEEGKALYGTPTFTRSDFDQSIETVTEGFGSTFHTLKTILSGMIPQRSEPMEAICDKEDTIEKDFVLDETPVARLPQNYGI